MQKIVLAVESEEDRKTLVDIMNHVRRKGRSVKERSASLKRQGTGSFWQTTRTMVSGNRRRYQDGTYDLDLTYITSRMIAMAFPGEDAVGQFSVVIRNRMATVKKFLDERHGGRYMVFNLCQERNYDAVKFDGKYVWIPVVDHEPPTLRQLKLFCNRVSQWLLQHPDNVAAVHCKGGKGRTGVMVCCWLLAEGQAEGMPIETPEEAINFFADRRTLDPNGPRQAVSGISQKRFISLFHRTLHGAPGVELRHIRILRLRMVSVPNDGASTKFIPAIRVSHHGKTVYIGTSKGGGLCKCMSSDGFVQGDETTVSMDFTNSNLVVSEEYRIEIFNGQPKEAASPALLFLCLHTCQATSSPMVFYRDEIDKVAKDTKFKVFSPNFSIEIDFEFVTAFDPVPREHNRFNMFSQLRKLSNQSLDGLHSAHTIRSAFASRAASASNHGLATTPTAAPDPAPPSVVVFNEDIELLFYQRCLANCSPETVQAGEIVAEDGSDSRQLVFIATGQLEVQRKANETRPSSTRSNNGHSTRTAAGTFSSRSDRLVSLGVFDVVGESALLVSGMKQRGDVVALEDSTLYCLSHEQAQALFANDMEWFYRFLLLKLSSKAASAISSMNTRFNANTFAFFSTESKAAARVAYKKWEVPVHEVVRFGTDCQYRSNRSLLWTAGHFRLVGGCVIFTASSMLGGETRCVRLRDIVDVVGPSAAESGTIVIAYTKRQRMGKKNHGTHGSFRKVREARLSVKLPSADAAQEVSREMLQCLHGVSNHLDQQAAAEQLRKTFSKIFIQAAGLCELSFKPGEVVDLKAAKHHGRLFLVMEGCIVTKISGWAILWSESGDTFGEFGYLLVDEFPWEALEVRAAQGQTLRVVSVPFQSVRACLLRDKPFAAEFLQFAAKRVALILNSWLAMLSAEG